MIRHNESAGKRLMFSWRVLLIVDDYFNPDQEETILDAASELIDADQIRHFVEEKLKDLPIDVEVRE